jgi:hypothetical protein
MKLTLLAVGFAVLVSMMLAPHGDKYGVDGFGPFFSVGALMLDGSGIFIGRVMIDMLALEIIFLGVLFAVVVNIRWRRNTSRQKPTSDINPA